MTVGNVEVENWMLHACQDRVLFTEVSCVFMIQIHGLVYTVDFHHWCSSSAMSVNPCITDLSGRLG